MVRNILRLDWHVIITSTKLLLFCCRTQLALYMNYFVLGMEIQAYIANGFTLLSLILGKLELKL
jgi:hypothetical protein